MRQDLRQALRQFGRSPLHTAAVVLILAIGIGANTAIFSLVHAVLLKPLPYAEPDRLVFLRQQMNGKTDLPFSWPNLEDLRRDNHSFSAVGVYTRLAFAVTGRGAAEQVQAATVNSDFLRVLGLSPLLGRAFTAAEDAPGAPRVVVLRESFWRRKFGGDPAVLGQSLTINAQPYTIVGVMPNAVMNPSGCEFWIPVAPFADNDTWRIRRNQPGLFAFGRLRPGVTLEQAQADLLAIGLRLQHDFPADDGGTLPTARPLMEIVTGSYRASLAMLMTAVGLLLVVACANVAGLQLVRGLGRAREFSIRAALGAGRAPLIRLLLVENVALAVAGGALGVLLAFWSIDGIRALSPATPRFQSLAVEPWVLGFCLALSVVSGLLFGLWPAWRASRVNLLETLHSGAEKGSVGGGLPRTRQAMVSLQVALTVVLLAGAALFGRSLLRIARFPYGFDPANLLLVQASLPDTPGAYDSDEKRVAFFEAVKARIAALPGVRSVGLNYSAPLRMDWSQLVQPEGRAPYPAGQEPTMEMGIIDPEYFPTLGVRLLRGRNFDATDRPGSPRTIIIDERMARAFWPGEDPIGKILLRGNAHGPIEKRRTTVIGVVPTLGVDGFDAGEPSFQGYLPQSQIANDSMNFVIRTDVVPRSLVDKIEAAVRSVDPNVPVYDVATMDELIMQESSPQRLYALLVALFAAAALALSGLGLYGVVAQAMAARRREIGIRMALGALSRQVIALVLRQGAWPLATGLVAGLAGALAGGRLVAGLLYQVSPVDPVALGAATLVLAAVGLLALWLPARRAARVDPAVALRSE